MSFFLLSIRQYISYNSARSTRQTDRFNFHSAIYTMKIVMHSKMASNNTNRMDSHIKKISPLQSPQSRLTYRLMYYLENYIKRPLCQNLYNQTPCFYRKRSRTTLKVCRTVRRSIRSKNDFGNRLSSLDITVKKRFLCKQCVIFHF